MNLNSLILILELNDHIEIAQQERNLNILDSIFNPIETNSNRKCFYL